jgi:hypothetical protein
MRFQSDISQNIRFIQFSLEQTGIVNLDSNQAEGEIMK